MNILGVHLTLWMGRNPKTASPVPFEIAEALNNVEVQHSDTGRSGFQLSFKIGRSGQPWDFKDYKLVEHPLLQTFSRVVIIVRFATRPITLMDGVITDIQFSPSNTPGASTMTVSGEDISVMMDLKQTHRSFPQTSDASIVSDIIRDNYRELGLIPPAPPKNPEALNPPRPNRAIPQQSANMTDRAYIEELARQYGFVFYVTPGTVPLTNNVFWGPPSPREGMSKPQSALSVNMGPATVVESINFRYDGLRAMGVSFTANDETRTIESRGTSRSMPMAANPVEPRRSTRLVNEDGERAETRAQAMADESFDSVVTATGELDAVRYGKVLEPRKPVFLRGVGMTYDGIYYVKSVSHRVSIGSYTQSFTLTREGLGTTTASVAVGKQ